MSLFKKFFNNMKFQSQAAINEMLPSSPNDRFMRKKTDTSIFDSKKFVLVDTANVELFDVSVPENHPVYKFIKISKELDFAQITFIDRLKYAGGILVEKVEKERTPQPDLRDSKKFFVSKSKDTDLSLLQGGATSPPTSTKEVGNKQTTPLSDFQFDKQSIYLHGVGELHFPNGDRYSGSFKKGLRSGYGIMIYQREKMQYYGEWHNGQKGGYGVCIYKDGSVYEGHWQHDKRHGSGSFTLSNGYVIKGNWNNDDIANAQFQPLSSGEYISKCSSILLAQMTENFKEIKFCYFSTNAQEKCYPQHMLCGRKWQGFFEAKESDIKAEAIAFQDQLPEDGTAPSKMNVKVFVKRNGSLLTSSVKEFIKVFHFRYNVITKYTAAQHKPHAMDDILSFVNDLYLTYLDVLGEHKNVFDDLYYTIKDFVLENSYELLMSIYRLAYKKQDDDLDLRLESLQNTTMKDIGVGSEFTPRTGEEGYSQPIMTLQTLEKETIPSRKFNLLKQVKKQVTDAMAYVRTNINGITKLKEQGADDSVPVYIYVFLKAAIPFAYSEMKYMIDLQDNRQRHSEAENAYTSIMEIPVEFLLKTDWNIRDDNGFLTQSSILEAQLERKYRDICNRGKNDSKFDMKAFNTFMKGCYIQLSNSLSISKGACITFDEELSPSFTQYRFFMEPILESTGLKLKKAETFQIEIVKPYPSYVYFNLAKVFLSS